MKPGDLVIVTSRITREDGKGKLEVGEAAEVYAVWPTAKGLLVDVITSGGVMIANLILHGSSPIKVAPVDLLGCYHVSGKDPRLTLCGKANTAWTKVIEAHREEIDCLGCVMRLQSG